MLDAFAGRMLAALYDAQDDGDSFVASPASTYVALEALARGAEGETFNEIDVVLGGGAPRKAACEALFGESDPLSARRLLLYAGRLGVGRSKRRAFTQVVC